jgi:hypothetical protein
MEKNLSLPQLTPAERETENEAKRLIEHVESALALVVGRSRDDLESIEPVADRIERASRDLAFALRELARQRRSSSGET